MGAPVDATKERVASGLRRASGALVLASIAGLFAGCEEALRCDDGALELAHAIGAAIESQAACARADECVAERYAVTCEGGGTMSTCPVAVLRDEAARVRVEVEEAGRGICARLEEPCNASSSCVAVERVDCVSGACVIVSASP